MENARVRKNDTDTRQTHMLNTVEVIIFVPCATHGHRMIHKQMKHVSNMRWERFKRIDLAKFVFSNLRCISINEFYILELYRLNGRLLCYVRGFTQLPQKRKAATYFEGPGGHGRPLLAGSYVTQRVRLAYSKPGTSTGPYVREDILPELFQKGSF